MTKKKDVPPEGLITGGQKKKARPKNRGQTPLLVTGDLGVKGGGVHEPTAWHAKGAVTGALRSRTRKHQNAPVKDVVLGRKAAKGRCFFTRPSLQDLGERKKLVHLLRSTSTRKTILKMKHMERKLLSVSCCFQKNFKDNPSRVGVSQRGTRDGYEPGSSPGWGQKRRLTGKNEDNYLLTSRGKRALPG